MKLWNSKILLGYTSIFVILVTLTYRPVAGAAVNSHGFPWPVVGVVKTRLTSALTSEYYYTDMRSKCSDQPDPLADCHKKCREMLTNAGLPSPSPSTSCLLNRGDCLCAKIPN